MVKVVNLSYEDLSSVLHYNPDTGAFLWKETTSARSKAGNRAGVWQLMQNGRKYFSVTYLGRKMSGSQLAWLLSYGVWPDRNIFFVDSDTTNLKLSNLKLADHKAERITDDSGNTKYKMTSEQVRHYGLARNYNLSLTGYAQMFTSQGGVCAICKKPETAKLPGRRSVNSEVRCRDLSVDHDHATGKIRELLCNACNHILGLAKDDKSILLSAAAYLGKHQNNG